MTGTKHSDTIEAIYLPASAVRPALVKKIKETGEGLSKGKSENVSPDGRFHPEY